MARVLVVEDEPVLLHTLAYNLRREGYEVVTVSDGASALRTARATPPDLVLLDIMLPVMSGLDVCRALRAEGSVPILLLTARSNEADKVVGLELGADDYITKPVGLPELMARVKAALRRSMMPRAASETGQDHASAFDRGGLRIDPSRREAVWMGAVLALRPREFGLLYQLAKHEGLVLSRDSLLSSVWGMEYVGDPRTVDVHVRWLRQKLEPEPAAPRFLQTVRGSGYRLVLPQEQPAAGGSPPAGL